MTDRPRVLVIAEAANPEWVSVPLVGWSLATGAARGRGCASRHPGPQPRRHPARGAGRRPGLHGDRFRGARAPALEARRACCAWARARAGPSSRRSARCPTRTSSTWSGRPSVRGSLAASSTSCTGSPRSARPWRARSRAKCRRVGVPFVVGPLNGGVPWPPGFDAERRREREWLSYVRGAYRLLPGRSATLGGGRGDRRLAASPRARSRSASGDRCVYIPENGIDPTRFSKQARHEPGPLRACFIGRMVPYKGPDMLLEAAHAAAARRTNDARDDRRRADARRTWWRSAAAAGIGARSPLPWLAATRRGPGRGRSLHGARPSRRSASSAEAWCSRRWRWGWRR